MTLTYLENTLADSVTLKDMDAGNDGGVYKATLVWQLAVSLDGASQVDLLPESVATLFAAYLPIVGSIYHPDRPLVTCRSVMCAREKAGIYTYTAKYSDENSTESESGTAENPLNDLPIVKPNAGMKPLAVHRDRDGNGLLNDANDPMPQSVDDNIVGFSVSANVASVPTWVLDLRNTCNSNAFIILGLSVPANAARFILPSDFLSEPKVRNEIGFYVFKYELEIDARDYHYARPLNAGFNQLVDGQKQAITFEQGAEPSEPVPLTTDGEMLENPTPETVNYKTFKLYPEASYAGLPGLLAV